MVDPIIITAFNEIYNSTQKKVLIYITAKCSNPADISDIFQETYLELFGMLKKHGINYIQNKEALVIKLAKQKIYKHYSLLDKIKRRIPFSLQADNENQLLQPPQEMDILSVEESYITRELLSQIGDFLSQQPIVVQKIFYLYYSFGLTIAQIAEELHLSQSNVKNRLYRTLKQIRITFNLSGGEIND